MVAFAATATSKTAAAVDEHYAVVRVGWLDLAAELWQRGEGVNRSAECGGSACSEDCGGDARSHYTGSRLDPRNGGRTGEGRIKGIGRYRGGRLEGLNAVRLEGKEEGLYLVGCKIVWNMFESKWWHPFWHQDPT